MITDEWITTQFLSFSQSVLYDRNRNRLQGFQQKIAALKFRQRKPYIFPGFPSVLMAEPIILLKTLEVNSWLKRMLCERKGVGLCKYVYIAWVPFAASHYLNIPPPPSNDRRLLATIATVGRRLSGWRRSRPQRGLGCGVLNLRRNQSCHHHQRDLPIQQTTPQWVLRARRTGARKRWE